MVTRMDTSAWREDQKQNALQKKAIVWLIGIFLAGIIGLGVYSLSGKSGNPGVLTNMGIQNPFARSEKITKATQTIDPNNYNTIKEFVSLLESATGGLDFTQENFVIGAKEKDGSGSITYIRFLQDTLGENSSLFDSKEKKNEAIQDIFSAYKSGDIFATSSHTGSVGKILFDDETGFPGTKEFAMILGKQKNVYKTIKDLENTAVDKYDREFLSFLYEFTGDYEKAAASRAKLCAEKNCTEDIPFTFSGTISDTKGNPVSWAKVTLLNDPSVNTTSDASGNYLISSNIAPFSLNRFKVTKEGFADGFHSVLVNQAIYAGTYLSLHDFVLLPPDTSIHLTAGNLGSDGYWTFSSSQSTYRLAKDSLSYMNGKPYSGMNIKVYLYEFSKTTNMDDFMNNDTFSPVYGYVGNIMKTFGMPYIQFFDENGTEIFVRSSRAMLLHNNIYHMKELYDNHDKIYTAITKEDMEYLVKVSKDLGGFPINFDWLTKNLFLRWPAWWVLDRKTGIWENVGSRVIDASGVVELPFYSINDGSVSIR